MNEISIKHERKNLAAPSGDSIREGLFTYLFKKVHCPETSNLRDFEISPLILG